MTRSAVQVQGRRHGSYVFGLHTKELEVYTDIFSVLIDLILAENGMIMIYWYQNIFLGFSYFISDNFSNIIVKIHDDTVS